MFYIVRQSIYLQVIECRRLFHVVDLIIVCHWYRETVTSWLFTDSCLNLNRFSYFFITVFPVYRIKKRNRNSEFNMTVRLQLNLLIVFDRAPCEWEKKTNMHLITAHSACFTAFALLSQRMKKTHSIQCIILCKKKHENFHENSKHKHILTVYFMRHIHFDQLFVAHLNGNCSDRVLHIRYCINCSFEFILDGFFCSRIAGSAHNMARQQCWENEINVSFD